MYLLASAPFGTLYLGVTSDLEKRIWQHKSYMNEGFSKRYGCKTLVWFETYPNIVLAIKREKSLKDYNRQWKINLIEKLNPAWEDLSEKIHQIENPFQPHPSHPDDDNYH